MTFAVLLARWRNNHGPSPDTPSTVPEFPAEYVGTGPSKSRKFRLCTNGQIAFANTDYRYEYDEISTWEEGHSVSEVTCVHKACLDVAKRAMLDQSQRPFCQVTNMNRLWDVLSHRLDIAIYPEIPAEAHDFYGALFFQDHDWELTTDSYIDYEPCGTECHDGCICDKENDFLIEGVPDPRDFWV